MTWPVIHVFAVHINFTNGVHIVHKFTCIDSLRYLVLLASHKLCAQSASSQKSEIQCTQPSFLGIMTDGESDVEALHCDNTLIRHD
jgi:hypothetical protein